MSSDSLRTVFSQFDLDGSNTLSAEELQVLFASIGLEMSEEEALTMLQGVDEDNNDELDYEEFLSLMQLQIESRAATLEAVWERYDRDGDGRCSSDEVHELVTMEMGLRLNAREFRQLMTQSYPDDDGHVAQRQLMNGLRALPQIRAKGLSEVCAKVRTIWEILDKDKSGTVDVKELCCDFAGRRLLNLSEVQLMGAGSNPDSEIKWTQFLKAMHLNPTMIKKLNRMLEQAVCWQEEDALRQKLERKMTEDLAVKAAVGAPLDNEDAIDAMLDVGDRLGEWTDEHQLEEGAAVNSLLGKAKGVAHMLRSLLPAPGMYVDKNRVQERMYVAGGRLVLEAVRLLEGRERKPVDYNNCETSVSIKLADLPKQTALEEKTALLKKMLPAAKKLWDTGELNGAMALDSLRQQLCDVWLPKKEHEETEEPSEYAGRPVVDFTINKLIQYEENDRAEEKEEQAAHWEGSDLSRGMAEAQFRRRRANFIERGLPASVPMVQPAMSWPPPTTPVRLFRNAGVSTPHEWNQQGSFHKHRPLRSHLWKQKRQTLCRADKPRFALTPPLRTGLVKKGAPNFAMTMGHMGQAHPRRNAHLSFPLGQAKRNYCSSFLPRTEDPLFARGTTPPSYEYN